MCVFIPLAQNDSSATEDSKVTHFTFSLPLFPHLITFVFPFFIPPKKKSFVTTPKSSKKSKRKKLSCYFWHVVLLDVFIKFSGIPGKPLGFRDKSEKTWNHLDLDPDTTHGFKKSGLPSSRGAHVVKVLKK